MKTDITLDAIPSLSDAFVADKAAPQHEYGEALLYDPALYQKFKKEQLHRPPPVDSPASVVLDPGAWEMPAAIAQRRSHRQFDRGPISFQTFSRAISVFRAVERDGEPRRCYPTTGGLCGIDVYVAVKNGRIDQVPEGAYFYNPQQNSLHRIGSQGGLGKEIHHHINRALVDASAFTLLFVFNAEVTTPVYGTAGYAMACIESGIMLATFNQVAESLGLGLCPVGLVDFDRAQAALGLKPAHKLIHLAECGAKLTPSPPCAASSTLTEAVAGCQNGDAPTVTDLRRFLSESLPDYMVPSEFLLVDSIPLTPNNKVDREALLRMASAESLELGSAFVAPESELETAILEIWRKLIHGRTVGVEDNFFDLGGDSMGVAEVQRQILEKFKVDLPIVKLFQYPTVRSTARFLKSQLQKISQSASPAPVKTPSQPDSSDQQALAWLRDNPQDPRAAAVAAKLKSRGFHEF